MFDDNFTMSNYEEENRLGSTLQQTILILDYYQIWES